MSTKKSNAETLNIHPDVVQHFRDALKHTCRQMMLSNSSITIDDSGKVVVEETRADFLITLGENFQKELSKPNLVELGTIPSPEDPK